MTGERVRRAERVIDLRKRSVDLAQAECASATLAAQEADQIALAAEDEWVNASRCAERCASSTDLERASAWLHTLRLRADRSAAEAADARAEVDRAHAGLVAARAELRRIELWRDGLVAAQRVALDRRERTATDEVAARTARRRP